MVSEVSGSFNTSFICTVPVQFPGPTAKVEMTILTVPHGSWIAKKSQKNDKSVPCYTVWLRRRKMSWHQLIFQPTKGAIRSSSFKNFLTDPFVSGRTLLSNVLSSIGIHNFPMNLQNNLSQLYTT